MSEDILSRIDRHCSVRPFGQELLMACKAEIELLRKLVEARDERLRQVETNLFFANRLRETEGGLLRSMIEARDVELKVLREAVDNG